MMNAPSKERLPKLDVTDRKILALLQQDASLSVAEIGSRVGLSSTPCWKRIQRLEADGVIQRRVALVDQDKIGLGHHGLRLDRDRRPFAGLARRASPTWSARCRR